MSTPSIPVEILDIIFEHAAHLNPRRAPSLSVISKRIQICVEKIMYKTLIIDYDNWGYPEMALYHKIMPTFRNRSTDFFTTHVKNLCLIVEDTDLSSPEFILAKCTGLRHLGLACPYSTGEGTWLLPSAPTLKSLTTDRRIFQKVADSGVTFAKLTYFWLSSLHYLPLASLEWVPALEATGPGSLLSRILGDFHLADAVKILVSENEMTPFLMLAQHSQIPLHTLHTMSHNYATGFSNTIRGALHVYIRLNLWAAMGIFEGGEYLEMNSRSLERDASMAMQHVGDQAHRELFGYRQGLVTEGPVVHGDLKRLEHLKKISQLLYRYDMLLKECGIDPGWEDEIAAYFGPKVMA
ncbi:hypothetical protein H0H87_001495 [Tephrocybe sp. NHM501043]|nr:hypothetical protein H0H87_001495 [Tephrocybe sp. NHM501043]